MAAPLPRPGCSAGPGGRPAAEHAELAAALVPAAGAELLALARCPGRRLAAAVRAGADLPAVDCSAMDGYALRVGELGPAGLPVVAHVPAGGSAAPLAPGTAQRIMTGAPLPPGADTVVPVELTDDGRAWVHVLAPVSPGRHVRRRGEDVRAGEVVLPAGTLLGPPHLAAAAACGLETLPVRRRLRVAVLSAGSELVTAGQACRPGQVPDTNAAMLVAGLTAAGADAHALPLVPDRPAELAALLAGHLPGVDLLVTSGGISAGDHEVVKDVLGPAGVDFARVALRPGGAQGLGTYRGVPVLCLPGNPVACWVGFALFLRPALTGEHARAVARTRSHLRAAPGRTTVVPAVRDAVSGEVRAVESVGAHSYRTLAQADALVVLGEHDAAPGEAVELLAVG